ncbi:MAG: YDG domain-containing protein, partial [Pseudomonadota bacterium]|nr:YDG domain-containing protein [Pseudomonadota bacterium]
TTSADITARALTVAASGTSRVYDGNTAAMVTLADNRVAGDSLMVGATGAAFADRNAGTGKTVNVSGIAISGADAANYAVNKTATTNADITARALAVSATGINRVYDGSTAASVTLADNRVAGDSLILGNRAATFADKNAGAGKTISVSGIAISGADAANYTANGTATTSADITARALAVTAAANSKLYSGSTLATVTLVDNRLAGDNLTVSATDARFADANPGMGKTVTVSGIRVAGPDAANYTANASATTRADVTSNAALDSAIGAVTNTNVVPTAVTQSFAVAGSTLQIAAAPASAGFVITTAMQSVLPAAVRQGSYVDAVMTPAAGEAGVSLSQSALAQLVRPGADGVLRVRLQQNGLASIVDGGVRLPDGVAQQFFIVPAQAAAKQ